MNETVYLSRARLRRDGAVSALMPLLLGQDDSGPGARTSPLHHSGHHLVWSLFTDGPDRRRDFLWREMERGTFMILSARAPVDEIGLFTLDEPKPFAPELRPGDRLRFSLRANPVVRKRKTPDAPRSVKHDVVMNAVHPIPKGARAAPRAAEIRARGFGWLEAQGKKAGFTLDQQDVMIEGYRQHRIPRRDGVKPMAFSTLDFDGILQVTDPAALVGAIARGFGSAKAFGCGLMLVRRA